MAQGTLSLARSKPATPGPTTPVQTYWGAVWRNFRRDPITMAALALLLLIIAVTLAAPWISANLLGFDPTDTNLRARKDPPTWAAEAWPQFQLFTRSCTQDEGCDWSRWGEIFGSSISGIQSCLQMGPGECHWMGTDDAGRDVLARGLYGGRISLRIGVYVTVISLTLGVFVGLICGYYATTWIDDVINAIILTVDSVPTLFLLIILARIFAPGPEGLSLLIGIFGWTGIARLLRGQIFALREQDYIVASNAVGSSIWRILFRHVLPNVSSLIILTAIGGITSAIIAEASLSYLGVGIGPPLASWGNMMQGSLGNFTEAPWLVLAPGFFIFLTTLSIYLLGDGLRDALDPWVKQ
jgi:peptide/nickel transport system permease protein